jgi:hypothetical protein
MISRFALAVPVLGGMPASTAAQQLSPIMPVDVSGSPPKLTDYVNLGWQSFIAVSWPAQPAQTGGIGGQPNPNLSITNPQAATLPTVWMTYLAKEQVFLLAAQNPGTWANPIKDYPRTPSGLPILGAFAKAGTSTHDEFSEATNNPLIDQRSNYVLYEIHLNQSEFTYISLTRYYDANQQIAAFPLPPAKPTFQPFPKTGRDLPPPNPPLPVWAQQGAVEIKAAWRILVTGKDDFSRFYTEQAYYETPDQKIVGPVTLGLVGLHVLRLTPSTGSTWYWATFEQVDNVAQNVATQTPSFNPGNQTYPNGYSYKPAPLAVGKPLPANPPVGVSRISPGISPDIQTLNAQYQKLLAPSVWQYYQMIQVQFPQPGSMIKVPVSGNSTNTADMRNTVLETYSYPKNTNCTACHGFGFPQMTPAANKLYGTGGTSGTYQIFTFLLGDAQKGPTVTNKP